MSQARPGATVTAWRKRSSAFRESRSLEEALATRPESQQVQLLLGIVKLDFGKTDEVSALVEKVSAKDPRSMWAPLGRAIVQRNRGQLPQAKAELEKIVKDKPDWTLAHSQLGQTLLMQQHNLALKAFDEAERTQDFGYARLRTARILLASGYRDADIERAQSPSQ